MANAGTGVIAPRDPVGSFDLLGDAHLPWTWIADLRLTKGLPIAGRQWTIFADIRNVLGTRNLFQVFAETGTEVNDIHRELVKNPYLVTLQNEAGTNLLPNGTVDLTNPCTGWSNATNCVALRRAEQRFGDGDGLYTAAEQEAAFDAFYESFSGRSQFYLPGRTIRLGIELRP